MASVKEVYQLVPLVYYQRWYFISSGCVQWCSLGLALQPGRSKGQLGPLPPRARALAALLASATSDNTGPARTDSAQQSHPWSRPRDSLPITKGPCNERARGERAIPIL